MLVGRAHSVYSRDTLSTVAAGEVLKFVLAAEETAISYGRENYEDNKMGLPRKMAHPSGERFKTQLDFYVEVAKAGDGYSMTFSKLRRAEQTTGFGANTGFSPIGA